MPLDWFAYDIGMSLGADLFSYIILEHERFFIHTVRAYLEHIDDPEERELIKAFIKQEAIHYTMHEQYNTTGALVGLDPDRERARNPGCWYRVLDPVPDTAKPIDTQLDSRSRGPGPILRVSIGGRAQPCGLRRNSRSTRLG